MSITVLIGDKGAGKTLLMTYMLHQDYLNGKRIISNYKLNFPHEILNSNMLMHHREELHDAVIGIDEASLYMDSRRSMSEFSVTISYFLFQSRKRSVDVYLTAQQIGSLDVRLRDNCDFIVWCRPGKIVNKNGKLVTIAIDGCKVCPDMIEMTEYDYTKTKMLIKYRRWRVNKDVFKLYDTDQIIDLHDDNDDDRPRFPDKMRKKILKRDHNRCRIWNCQSKSNLEVHHIFVNQTQKEELNKANNGIVLCKKHHAIVFSLEDGITNNFYKSNILFITTYLNTIKNIFGKNIDFVFDGKNWRLHRY